MIKILIVEDELPISKLIEMNLTDAGYTCTSRLLRGDGGRSDRKAYPTI